VCRQLIMDPGLLTNFYQAPPDKPGNSPGGSRRGGGIVRTQPAGVPPQTDHTETPGTSERAAREWLQVCAGARPARPRCQAHA